MTTFIPEVWKDKGQPQANPLDFVGVVDDGYVLAHADGTTLPIADGDTVRFTVRDGEGVERVDDYMFSAEGGRVAFGLGE